MPTASSQRPKRRDDYAISRLHVEDFAEALDVLNLAFGKAPPRDFEAILPVLYRRGEEEMSWNFGLRENGRIRAIVGLFPLAGRWGGATLRMAGIGRRLLPSTRPRPGLHAATHGPLRPSRARRGFSPVLAREGSASATAILAMRSAGVYYRLTLSQTNVRHAFGAADFGIDFRPLEREDRTHLQGVIGLHDAQPFRGVRAPHRFYNLLLSWGHRPYVARSRDGRMIGYLVAQADRTGVTELLAVNEGEPELDIAAAWVQRLREIPPFELPPWSRLLPKLARLCEGVSASSSGNWQIFDWAATLDALLKTHAALVPLMDGAVVVEIAGYGRVALEVRGNAAQCVRTEAAPALQMDAFTAMRLLCGPLRPSLVLPLPSAAAPLEQWCPLPLFWGRQDAV